MSALGTFDARPCLLSWQRWGEADLGVHGYNLGSGPSRPSEAGFEAVEMPALSCRRAKHTERPAVSGRQPTRQASADLLAFAAIAYGWLGISFWSGYKEAVAWFDRRPDRSGPVPLATLFTLKA